MTVLFSWCLCLVLLTHQISRFPQKYQVTEAKCLHLDFNHIACCRCWNQSHSSLFASETSSVLTVQVPISFPLSENKGLNKLSWAARMLLPWRKWRLLLSSCDFYPVSDVLLSCPTLLGADREAPLMHLKSCPAVLHKQVRKWIHAICFNSSSFCNVHGKMMYETAYSVCTWDFEEVAKCFYSKQGTVFQSALCSVPT